MSREDMLATDARHLLAELYLSEAEYERLYGESPVVVSARDRHDVKAATGSPAIPDICTVCGLPADERHIDQFQRGDHLLMDDK